MDSMFYKDMQAKWKAQQAKCEGMQAKWKEQQAKWEALLVNLTELVDGMTQPQTRHQSMTPHHQSTGQQLDDYDQYYAEPYVGPYDDAYSHGYDHEHGDDQLIMQGYQCNLYGQTSYNEGQQHGFSHMYYDHQRYGDRQHDAYVQRPHEGGYVYDSHGPKRHVCSICCPMNGKHHPNDGYNFGQPQAHNAHKEGDSDQSYVQHALERQYSYGQLGNGYNPHANSFGHGHLGYANAFGHRQQHIYDISCGNDFGHDEITFSQPISCNIINGSANANIHANAVKVQGDVDIQVHEDAEANEEEEEEEEAEDEDEDEDSNENEDEDQEDQVKAERHEDTHVNEDQEDDEEQQEVHESLANIDEGNVDHAYLVDSTYIENIEASYDDGLNQPLHNDGLHLPRRDADLHAYEDAHDNYVWDAYTFDEDIPYDDDGISFPYDPGSPYGGDDSLFPFDPGDWYF